MNLLKKILSCILCLVAIMGESSAQRIKESTIEYAYFRLPLSPVDKSITNYQAVIDAAFEAKNKQLMDQYETDKLNAQKNYEQETATYSKRVKEAEDRYDKEMEDYNKKSLGKKIVEKNMLGENNKPVKKLPPVPYLQKFSPPVLQSSYDYPALANTYLHVDGLNNQAANALKLIVTLYGYDFTQPRVLNNQQNVMTVSSGSSPQTSTKTYYHTEYSYRHPMSVKVLQPDGKELMNVTPSELNIYKIYKSGETDKTQSVNGELLIKSAEEKVLQDNLNYVNNLINSKFGSGYAQRKATLSYVKDKGDGYADLTTAFNEASAALPMLQQDSTTAKANLNDAISIWQKALKEADPSDKKARIDKDVMIAICFNLLETYFATGNIAGGREVLQKMNALNMSFSERNLKNTFESLFTDLALRQKANN